MSVPKVIPLVVDQGLCTGCGMCVSQCKSNSLRMGWNDLGFLVPHQIGECDENCNCIEVCPFNPYPKPEVQTEDELAAKFLDEATSSHPKVGKYERIYAGYSNQFRATSSSGGLATYVFMKIFQNRIADHIIVVGQKDGFYEYQVLGPDELMNSSKTKYFPVTMADVFQEVDKAEGKVAVVGVACFIKAIRLAQNKNPLYKEKISFLVGIICGGLKSSFFTDYLASRVGFENGGYEDPDYRIKDFNSTAADYSFGCRSKTDTTRFNQIKMKKVGDMWGTGLFKANACDFCEDVTTELADISLGDAWINPYSTDGKGTSVVVTRTQLSESLIQDGIEKQELTLEDLHVDRLIRSQQGSFNHRHDGLKFRINKRKQLGLLVPPKRKRNLKSIGIFFALVQKARMKTRENSLRIWKEYRNAGEFDKGIAPDLKRLKRVTKLYHMVKKWRTKFRL